MDVLGQQFLAGSGLAHDQNAGVGFGGHGGLLDHAQERGAGADHLGACSHDLPQTLVLFAEAGLFQSVLERDQHFVATERLFEEIKGAGAGSFDGFRDGGVAGDHDGWSEAIAFAQLA